MKIILIGVLAFTAVAVWKRSFTRCASCRIGATTSSNAASRLSAAPRASPRGSAGLLRRDKLSSNPTIDALLRGLKLSARLENLLEQTELEMTVGTLLGFCLGGLLGGVLLGIIAGSGPVMTIVLGLLFGSMPIFFVMFKRARRSLRALRAAARRARDDGPFAPGRSRPVERVQDGRDGDADAGQHRVRTRVRGPGAGDARSRRRSAT